MKVGGLNSLGVNDPVEFAIFLHELACGAQTQRKDAELACLLSIRVLEKAVGPNHPYISEAMSTLSQIRNRATYVQRPFHIN